MKKMCTKLDSAAAMCSEIQEALIKHLRTTTNELYKPAIEAGIVVLNNLFTTITAIKECAESNHICKSTELLMRIVAYDYFQKKLAFVPEKKNLNAKIIEILQEVHMSVFRSLHAN